MIGFKLPKAIMVRGNQDEGRATLGAINSSRDFSILDCRAVCPMVHTFEFLLPISNVSVERE